MLKRCKRCGEFHGEECLARAFTVWQDEEDETKTKTIYAWDKADAAKKFAAWYDQEDDNYSFATVGGVVVVRHEHDAEEKEEKFFVEGELVPRYYANNLRGRR